MPPPKQPIGLSTVPPDRRREIARMGGIAAQRLGNAHKWTPETARLAGKKGGTATAKDVQHMKTIGRSGGRRTAELKKAT